MSSEPRDRTGIVALAAAAWGLDGLLRATFAELAFPATAAFVGVIFLESRLTRWQWTGFAIVIVSIAALGWNERMRRPVVRDGATAGDGP